MKNKIFRRLWDGGAFPYYFDIGVGVVYAGLGWSGFWFARVFFMVAAALFFIMAGVKLEARKERKSLRGRLSTRLDGISLPPEAFPVMLQIFGDGDDLLWEWHQDDTGHVELPQRLKHSARLFRITTADGVVVHETEFI